MDSVVHFELPYEDSKRVSDFYSSVFGWQLQNLGPEMGDYVLATTTETGDEGPLTPGAINGGLAPKTDSPSGNHPSLVISVENLEEAMKKVTGFGGHIVGDPVDIHGVGLYVSFRDSEGNYLSMLQAFPRK